MARHRVTPYHSSFGVKPAPPPNTRIIIAGSENGFAGYNASFVPAGEEARQVSGGPLVPGPWAALFGLGSVIDNHGGTAGEITRERAAGTVVEATAGDELEIEGVVFVLALDARRYPHLIPAGPNAASRVAEIASFSGLRTLFE